MPSSQEYVQRLLDEATRTLSPQVKGLEAEFQNIRQDITQSLNRLAGRLDSLHSLELPTSGTVLREIFEEISQRRDDEWSSLSAFGRKLLQAETQEEILNLLLDEASLHAPRLVLFVARGEKIAGWSSRGFSEDTAKDLRSTSFLQSQSAAIANALAAQDPGKVIETAGETRLLEALHGETEGAWHLFPMKVMRRPVAVLFAADCDCGKANRAACQLLVGMTVLRLENIALQILRELGGVAPESRPAAAAGAFVSAPVEEETAVAASVAQEAPPTPVLAEQIEAAAPETPAAAEELSAPTETPAIEMAVEAVAPAPLPMEAEGIQAEEAVTATEAGVIETMAEEAAPETVVPELEVAEEKMPPAPAMAEMPAESAGAAAPAVKEDTRLAEEERLHSDAKRFARLLVSEIKLYNEQRVVEGRENRDLYVRLKRDIDRSREMYEKRVAPSVAQKIDYFHDELVRILGENDSLTLGSDYPGPRIES